VIRKLPAMLACMIFTAHACADDPLAIALDRVDTAIEQHAADDPERVLEAAALLASALRDEGISTSESELALGNAHLLGGDLGRAILHYRRGLELDPRSARLRANLEHARSFVEPAPRTPAARPIAERVALSWRGVVDRRVLWWAGAVSLGVLSITLTLRASGGSSPRRIGATRAALAALVLSAAPLAAESWIVATRSDAVVIEPGVMAYSGPGREAYDKVYEQPLGVGTEGRVLGARHGWIELALANDERAWIPEHAAARIKPPR